MMWLTLGIVMGLGLAYLLSGVRSGRLSVRWYQWVLGAIAALLFLLAIQNYFALQDELEPKLATFSAIAFGVPGIVAAVLAWFAPSVGRRTAKKGASATAKMA